jgi:hypothetical protein
MAEHKDLDLLLALRAYREPSFRHRHAASGVADSGDPEQDLSELLLETALDFVKRFA